MEDFYTIQGEGYNTGRPAYFIRLGGCDIGCVWCDVKDSWDAQKHSLMTIDQIISKVGSEKCDNVVITGGEPCLYSLKPLTDALHHKFYSCWIETSGAYPITGNWEWICVSPKKFKMPLTESLYQANELKVVVFNSSDFDFALENAKGTNPDCQLFLQPEYSKFKEMMPELIRFVKQNPNWRISLQTHKIMQIP